MLESLLLHLRKLVAPLAALAMACSLCSAGAVAQVSASEQQRFRRHDDGRDYPKPERRAQPCC
jgi:hypothetical protein